VFPSRLRNVATLKYAAVDAVLAGAGALSDTHLLSSPALSAARAAALVSAASAAEVTPRNVGIDGEGPAPAAAPPPTPGATAAAQMRLTAAAAAMSASDVSAVAKIATAASNALTRALAASGAAVTAHVAGGGALSPTALLFADPAGVARAAKHAGALVALHNLALRRERYRLSRGAVALNLPNSRVSADRRPGVGGWGRS
jgi:hypothetical protein